MKVSNLTMKHNKYSVFTPSFKRNEIKERLIELYNERKALQDKIQTNGWNIALLQEKQKNRRLQ